MRLLPIRLKLPRLSAVMKHLTFVSHKLRYVSIRTKILLLPVIALTGLLGYSLYTVVVSRANTDTLDGFAARTLPVMRLAAQANQGLVETQGLFTQALGDKDEFLVEDAAAQAASTRSQIEAIKQKDPSYSARIDELVGLWDRYVDKSETAVNGIIAGTGDMQTFQQLAAEKQAAFEAIRDALSQLNRDSEAVFQDAIDAASAQSSLGLKVGIGIVLTLSLLTVLTALQVDAAIRQPIERLNRAIGQVAQGDFGVRVDAEGRDAISTMCQAFNSLLSDLNAAIGETNRVLAAVGRGDFSTRIDAELPGDLARLKAGVNDSADSVQRTMDALDAVMEALARGDFSARMSEDVQGDSRRKVDGAMSLLQRSLAALKGSLSAAAEGDFSRRIDDQLPGDLGQLKDAVNQSLSALEGAFGEISATTQALAEGDLTRRAQGHYAGSLRALTEALNGSLDSLVDVLREVASSAQEVSFGVDEIAKGNEDLSVRTERQAAALEQSSASIEQLLTSARSTADNSSQTSDLTKGALESTREGTQVAARAGQSMEAITDASRRIGDFVGLIDSVAFQTNLLALNAAVEAARAGEQGRGFAVVASEVRSLAQRTADAAKEIRVLIGTSSARVQEGTGLVGRSCQQLEAINQSNETIAQLAQQAAASAHEQSLGLQQLSKAVSELEVVNQQNSALVEEVTASSASLRDRAMSLRESVSRFTLEQARVQAPSRAVNASVQAAA